MSATVTLDKYSPQIVYLCQRDKRLAKVISMVGPIKYSIKQDPYDFLIHEIIEQMLSVKAGHIIYNRLCDLCDGHITVEAISSLSDDEIKGIGTAKSKVSFIRSLTDVAVHNPTFFEDLIILSDEEVFKRLISIRGIGPWTAKMYLLFVLNREDILPYEDVAFLQGYSWVYKTNDLSPDAVKNRCKKWKPYSSIAARYMYRTVDTGLTKQEFHLYK